MKNSTTHFSFQYTKYENLEDLPSDFQHLMLKAIEGREKAYAPYSNFLVGVAILLDNGEVIIGNNQENAAYPSGLCAERTAIFYAKANFPDAKILKIALTGKNKDIEKITPLTPCGGCRQSILEYEITQDSPIQIACMGSKSEILVVNSVKDLLPFSFEKKELV